MNHDMSHSSHPTDSESGSAKCGARFDLRRHIYADLQHLFTYAGAVEGQTESAYETLAYPELFPAAMAALAVQAELG